jgi:integrase
VLHAALKAACLATKVPRFGLHDLRRAFATQAVRAGVPLTVVRDWLGHRLVATTERYVGRYRSDGDLVAPTPAGLGAEVVQKSGVPAGHLQSISAPERARSGRR